MSQYFAAVLTDYMDTHHVDQRALARRCGYTLAEMVRILAGLHTVDAQAQSALMRWAIDLAGSQHESAAE